MDTGVEQLISLILGLDNNWVEQLASFFFCQHYPGKLSSMRAHPMQPTPRKWPILLLSDLQTQVILINIAMINSTVLSKQNAGPSLLIVVRVI